MARGKPELGKWLLWLHFNRLKRLRRYLPLTKKFSEGSLRDFLQRYGTVYVKPTGGSRGRGVIKVWLNQGHYWVKQTTLPARRYESFAVAYVGVHKLCGRRSYIVQKGIALAKVSGRPFDIRVMVQKERPGGRWVESGMIAKIAGPGSVVTNVALSRGRVMEIEQALAQSLGWGPKRIAACVQELREMSLLAARHFDTYQPYREIGFDWAIESSGRLWLLEENTGPSHPLFAKLKSKPQLYRQIQWRWGRYQRALKR